MASAHDFNFPTIDNKPLDMKGFAGKPVLVVNVASYCGFTPQYTTRNCTRPTGPRASWCWACRRTTSAPKNPGRAEIASSVEHVWVKFRYRQAEGDRPDAHALYQWIAQEAGGAPHLSGTSPNT